MSDSLAFAVKGRDACEIKMVHQEDAGLNVEMAKLAFAKGIWSYVCKMDDALRRHSSIIQNPQLSSSPTAVTLIQKVRSCVLHINSGYVIIAFKFLVTNNYLLGYYILNRLKKL